MKKYVAYYRVSTKQQGISGLGLEAQKQSVRSFTHCEMCIVAEYTEVESGKNDKREQLAAAIADAKRQSATLVIAKLDRLSRNAGFIFALRDSGVDFVCADMPDANTLTIGIFAILAQHERELISQRTKAALSAKKSQGFTLGNPQNLTDTARAKGRANHSKNARANENNRRASTVARNMRKQGLALAKIADELNEGGFKSSRGGTFYASTVQHLLTL